MKKLFLLFAFVMIVGCSPDNETTTINGYTEPMVDAYGLTLEPSDEMYISFETVSRLYQDTMACMGMTATAPTVAWKSFSEQYIGGAWGVYVSTGKLVWINTDNPLPNVERNKVSDIETLKHEYVHHILFMNNIPHHDGESPELFEKCGMGVYVKDGVPTAK